MQLKTPKRGPVYYAKNLKLKKKTLLNELAGLDLVNIKGCCIRELPEKMEGITVPWAYLGVSIRLGVNALSLGYVNRVQRCVAIRPGLDDTAFCAHAEDFDLGYVSYLHKGAPKYVRS